MAVDEGRRVAAWAAPIGGVVRPHAEIPGVWGILTPFPLGGGDLLRLWVDLGQGRVTDGGVVAERWLRLPRARWAALRPAWRRALEEGGVLQFPDGEIGAPWPAPPEAAFDLVAAVLRGCAWVEAMRASAGEGEGLA
ncbi:MAG: hypothetical protein K6U87_06895 [Firmicutes bacterium]|nr:hypothetical protein [Bacillota bacterium]